MSLKISRQLLEKIVEEEFIKFIREQKITEAPSRTTSLGDEDEDKKLPSVDDKPPSGGEQFSIGDPDVDPVASPEEIGGMDDPAIDSGGGMPAPGGDEEAPPDLPGDEHTHGEMDPELDVEQGSIAADIMGKTVDTIEKDDESKIIPGASEIIVKFTNNPDPLRILLTKSGEIKFYYRDSLHSELGTASDGEEGEEEGDLEDFEPMGDEDMPENDGIPNTSDLNDPTNEKSKEAK